MNKVPQTMRAAAIDRFGGPEVLAMHTLPVPEIGDVEVLIAVHTAGVGIWDADMRGGWLPDGKKPRFPVVLGTDGSGHIAQVGSRVRRFKIGDPVYAYSFGNPKGGFYAEYVAVSAEKVAHKPSTLDLEHAGAIGTTGLTALQGIDVALGVKKGESVIIHGATGGVGTLALQFAKLRGARVLATATSNDGVALVRGLGGDAAVDGKRENITDAARKFATEGVDAVFAASGGEALERCIDALRKGGRVAYPNGVEPEPKKRAGIEIVAYDGTPGVREFEHLNKAVDESKLQVPIAAAFKLEEAAKAHERVEEGHVFGKIVLRVR
jgi:NADPH:quinone reductase-like Zn-dependent oxidoreductase